MAEWLSFGQSAVRRVSISRPSVYNVCHRNVSRGLTSRHFVKATCSNGVHEHGISSDLDVYAISDLHTDYPVNMGWVESLSDDKYQNDLLIVAGDISDNLEIIRDTLSALIKKFKHVAFVPGNHELWIRGRIEDSTKRNGDAINSMEKLNNVLECCQELGVIISPKRFGNLWVAPILSWHHQSFDKEPDIAKIPAATKLTISDYRSCQWPPLGLENPEDANDVVARHFDALNDESWLELAENCDIITFSHFLPRQDLLPEKRFLYYPNVAKAVGSLPLGRRLERINPNIHVFGHSHFGWDATLDGIRYVQCPLCYPAERLQRTRTVVLYDSPSKSYLSKLLKKSTDQVARNVDWLPTCIYSTRKKDYRKLQDQCRANSVSLKPRRAVNVVDEAPSTSMKPVMMAKPERRNVVEPRVVQRNSQSRSLKGEMREWHAVWSDHYLEHKRDPNNVERAAWVGRRKRNSIRTKV